MTTTLNPPPPLSLEEFLASLQDDVEQRRHQGPGPHKTGSPQSIHGSGHGTVPMVIAKAGGYSVQPLTGVRPTSGFMVARPPEFGAIVQADDWFGRGDEVMLDFVDSRISTFEGHPDSYVGIWWDRRHAEVALDVSINVQDMDEAIRLGREWNQQSIWDVVNQREIPTGGTGGRSGVVGPDPAAGELVRTGPGAEVGVVPGARGRDEGPDRRDDGLRLWRVGWDAIEALRRWGGAYEQPRWPAGSPQSKGGQFMPKGGHGYSGIGAGIGQSAGASYRDNPKEQEEIAAELAEMGLTPEGVKAEMRSRMKAAKSMKDPYPFKDEDESAYDGGRKWYGRAHGECVLIGEGDPERGAALVAVLSKQTPWPNNVNMAYALRDLTKANPDLSPREIAAKFMADRLTMRDKYGPLEPADVGKLVSGVRILRGEPPDKILGGQKVRNFYNGLVSTRDVGSVTIDSHMLKILMLKSNVPPKQRKDVGSKFLGTARVGSGTGKRKRGTGRGYGFMAAMIEDVAAEMGMEPRQVQAILWNTAVNESWLA